MELIHEKSAPSSKSEVLGLSSLPTTQEDVKAGHWEIVGPTQTLTGATSVEFTAGSGAFCTDLSKSFVEVEFTVTKTGGSIVAADACAPTNLFAHSLWSKVLLSVNDIDVTSGDRNYPYSAAIMTLIGKHSSWASSGQLEGFYKDTAGSMDDRAAANTGFMARKALITAATAATAAPIVCIAFRPYLGMCQQQKIIPDRTKLSLQLEKAADNFALIHNNVAGATITITRARWHVRRVELTESAGRALSQILLKENALYSFDRVRVHQQTFRTTAFDFDGLLAGAVPTHIVIGFVSSAAAQGTANVNPYNFANMGLSRLQISAAGFNYPQKEYTPRFVGNTLAGAKIAREYDALMKLAHRSGGPEGLLFSMADFCGGYGLYAFDLTPDLDHGHWSPSYRGDIEVHGEFAVQPAADVTMVMLALIPSVIEISGEREIIRDW